MLDINTIIFQRLPYLDASIQENIDLVSNFKNEVLMLIGDELSKKNESIDLSNETTFSNSDKLITAYHSVYNLLSQKGLKNSEGEKGNQATDNIIVTSQKADVVSQSFQVKDPRTGILLNYTQGLELYKKLTCAIAKRKGLTLDICYNPNDKADIPSVMFFPDEN